MRNKLAWHSPPTISPADKVQNHVGGHPLVAQILAQRGITTLSAVRAFLSPDHYAPTPPSALPDLERIVARLGHAIQHHEKILIWGDFDVDGQTATALLLDALTRLGAQVAFYIPHRLRESHGIQVASLKQQIAQCSPTVLLTCDTGVSAFFAIDYAKSLGITILVTDHHDLPPTLPNADAILNPKRLPEAHPLASLPGVGVVYKLVEHLYTQHGREAELDHFLDLVALGIVADVAEQTKDTRYLLQIGLEQLQNTQRTGLQALIETANLNPDQLRATDIGFQLGPRLNAAGRLDDARPVVELLTTDDPAQAQLLAAQLEGLNNQRRLQSDQIYTATQEQITQDPTVLDWEGLVLAHPAWHPGIIGIVASRLADRYQRPVVLLSIADDGTARGSARSVPGYDIGAAIAAQADLLDHHGGHPGAAGLALPADNIPAFRRRLSDTLREIRDPEQKPGLTLDAIIPLDETTLELAHELNRLAPFGEGNPPVTLATTDVELKSAALFGSTQRHRRLTITDKAGTQRQVIWWQSADQPLPEGTFDIAYHLALNTYRGNTELQITLLDYRRSETATPTVEHPARTITDYRGTTEPTDTLHTACTEYPEAAIWAEGYRRAASPGHTLANLAAADTLIIYTTPPTPQALQSALEQVNPTHAILIGVDPPINTLTAILKRVLSLIKYILNHQDGKTTLSALAGAVGQSHLTIRAILDYYAARGDLQVAYNRSNSITVTYPPEHAGIHDDHTLSAHMVTIKSEVAETAAYRAFFQRADPYMLLGWDKP